MKTLVKLTKSNKHVPIFATVKVQAGRAYATDLDMRISDTAPPDVKDGLYHGAGFVEGLYHRSEIDPADFPQGIAQGDLLGSIDLPRSFFVNDMAWVFKAAVNEQTRYYLTGVCFHLNKIISCDGHRLHMATAPDTWPANDQCNSGMILPPETVRAVIDMVKEKKTVPSVRVAFHRCGFTFFIGEAVIESKIIDGTFPNWQQVVIPEKDYTHKTLYNPAHIAIAINQAKILEKINNGKLSKDGPAMVFERNIIRTNNTKELKNGDWQTGSLFITEIGFRAKYLADLPAGLLSYRESNDPIRIDTADGNRTAVVMPLRVS